MYVYINMRQFVMTKHNFIFISLFLFMLMVSFSSFVSADNLTEHIVFNDTFDGDLSNGQRLGLVLLQQAAQNL